MKLRTRWLVFTPRAEPCWPVEGLRKLASPVANPEPPRGVRTWKWAGVFPNDPLPEGPLFLRQVDQDPGALEELLDAIPAEAVRGLDLKPGTRLTGLGELSLEELALDYWGLDLGAEGLEELHGLDGLRWLSLVETRGAAKLYRELIAPLSSLEALNLRDRSVSAALLKAIGEAAPQLRALSLCNLELGAAAVAALAKLSGLERLDFYCASFKEPKLQGLDELPLRSLAFRGLSLPGELVVAWLTRLAPTLEALEFPLFAETCAAMPALAEAPSLRYLSCFPLPSLDAVPALSCLPEGLRWLALPVEALAGSPGLLGGLPELERVRLTWGKFAPEGAVQQTFEALPRSVRWLGLSGQLDDFSSLSDFSELKVLDFQDLLESSWPELELPRLRHLGLRSCSTGVDDLARLNAPDLRSLDLAHCDLKDLRALAAFPRLAALNLPGQLVEPGLAPLADLRASLRWVEPFGLGTQIEPPQDEAAAEEQEGWAGTFAALFGPRGSKKIDPWAELEVLELDVVGTRGATRRNS